MYKFTYITNFIFRHQVKKQVSDSERFKAQLKKKKNNFYVSDVYIIIRKYLMSSVAEPDPEFGAFLTPGSGVWDEHLGSATLLMSQIALSLFIVTMCRYLLRNKSPYQGVILKKYQLYMYVQTYITVWQAR